MTNGTIAGKARTILGRAVRGVVADYRLNWILESPPHRPALPLAETLEVRRFGEEDEQYLARSEDAELRKALGYHRDGATGFILADKGEPACAVHFVAAAGYTHAGIWPLGANQLALVNIVTRRTSRGRGFAPMLISHATSLALQDGFDSALCFIWWNHRASLAAFRRAGWRCIGFSVELVRHKGDNLRLHLPLRLHKAARIARQEVASAV